MKNEHFHRMIRDLEADESWEREMVRDILWKRRKSRVLAWAGTGAAAAAVIITVFYAWLSLSSYMTGSVEYMITAQIDGTYHTVFHDRERSLPSYASEKESIDSDIDSVIENSLEMR